MKVKGLSLLLWEHPISPNSAGRKIALIAESGPTKINPTMAPERSRYLSVTAVEKFKPRHLQICRD
jgi:hypothetical protein